jgi:hypothetical protein
LLAQRWRTDGRNRDPRHRTTTVDGAFAVKPDVPSTEGGAARWRAAEPEPTSPASSGCSSAPAAVRPGGGRMRRCCTRARGRATSSGSRSRTWTRTPVLAVRRSSCQPLSRRTTSLGRSSSPSSGGRFWRTGCAPPPSSGCYLRKRGTPVWCTRIAPDETLTEGIRPSATSRYTVALLTRSRSATSRMVRRRDVRGVCCA